MKKEKTKKELDKEFKKLMESYSEGGLIKASPIQYNDLDDRFYDESDLSLYDDYEEQDTWMFMMR